jgi:ATP-dependent Clp protease ATP-binding subunit ClpB
MQAIVEVQFARLAKRLVGRNIIIKLDKTVENYLAANGYSSTYGARPLKRVIHKDIENVLAEMILKGDIQDGQKILIKANGENLDFNVTYTNSHL